MHDTQSGNSGATLRLDPARLPGLEPSEGTYCLTTNDTF